MLSVEMPKINPLYLDPVVGYLMWYLSAPRRRKLPQGGHDIHQFTEQEALDRARSHKPFTGITESEFQLALQWARNNLAASEAMKSITSSHHDYTTNA